MDIALFAKKGSRRTEKNEPLVKNIVLPAYFAVSHSSDERLVIMLRSQMEAVTKKGSHIPFEDSHSKAGKKLRSLVQAL